MLRDERAVFAEVRAREWNDLSGDGDDASVVDVEGDVDHRHRWFLRVGRRRSVFFRVLVVVSSRRSSSRLLRGVLRILLRRRGNLRVVPYERTSGWS